MATECIYSKWPLSVYIVKTTRHLLGASSKLRGQVQFNFRLSAGPIVSWILFLTLN